MPESPRDPSPAPFDLSAGALCLDLVNTLGNRIGPEPLEEGLGSYGDLVELARQSGAIDGTLAGRLLDAARDRPAGGKEVLARAVRLREALHGIFGALAAGRRPTEQQLAGLNAELAPALAHARLAVEEGGFALSWEDPASGSTAAGVPLERPLWPFARSAMELLLDADLSRIGACQSDTCGFLFLDTTRNRSRRWCDTRICGNRARVRRHRRRVAEAE